MADPEATAAEEAELKVRRVPWTRAWPLFRRFFRWVRPDAVLALTILMLLVLAVPAGVVAPELIRRVFDDALKNHDVDLLLDLGAWIVGLTLAAHLLRLASSLLGVTLKTRVRGRVAGELFEHVLRLPLRYFHRHETGYVMSRVREDVAALDALMADTLAHAAVDAARAVLFFALLLFTDLGLAVSGLGLLALIICGVMACNPALRARSERAQEAEANFNATLHQALSGIFTLRVTAQEPKESARYAAVLETALDAVRKRDRFHSVVGYVIGLAVALGGYVILTIGAFRILRGSSTVGSLFQFAIYMTYVGGAVTSLMALNPAIQHALVSLQRIFKVLDERPEEAGVEEPPAAGDVQTEAPLAVVRSAEGIRGRVEFDRVSFHYDEAIPALREVSFAVEPGEVIALVGRSGAGKTTLVHLIPRLYDPTEGEIRVDGVPLRDYELRSLRSRIGVVPQDVFLFNRSIKENIAYGAPHATDEQIVSAARAAHADEFVRRFPQGYDTIVGERGVKLSGGERQRIAIAREILRDPPILILDEATSSLDSESESLIREAVERLKKNRTSFVIAHRLSTVVGADRILVLERGKIVEAGRHDELLAADGPYRRLYSLQLGAALDEVG